MSSTKLIERKILNGQLAFIERGTHRLFVPLVQDEFEDGTIAFWNAQFRCGEQFMDERFVQIKATWDIIFRFDPDTLELKEYS